MPATSSSTSLGVSPNRAGFTLLELCIVLLIIAILAGAMMPSIHSAFVENAMRADARELSLLVKSAMLQSTDEHQNYVLDLEAKQLDLHRVASDADAESTEETTYRLDPADRLLIPDPDRNSAWITMPATSWLFQPGELCPASRVRLVRGSAWVELNFNALTGNIENESAYFP